jgi:hypothetical protein
MTEHLGHDPHGHMVRIEAMPQAISIETSKTAVLVVDIHHDFGATESIRAHEPRSIHPIRTPDIP